MLSLFLSNGFLELRAKTFLFFNLSLSLGNYNISNVLPAAPDMTQFKQGVKSVAGKLSILANGVMTSIQVNKLTNLESSQNEMVPYAIFLTV